jgi:type VI secretion system secreted protein Hcp
MAVVDYFLKLDGIDGESNDDKHKGSIDISSWSWSESQTGTHSSGGGGGAGKVKMQDLQLTAPVSKASPRLLLVCASGEHLKKAQLTCRKAGKDQQEYLKIILSDVLVSSYTVATGAGVVPGDQFTLNFAKIEVEYKEQKADGSLGGATKAGWVLKENRPA